MEEWWYVLKKSVLVVLLLVFTSLLFTGCLTTINTKQQINNINVSQTPATSQPPPQQTGANPVTNPVNLQAATPKTVASKPATPEKVVNDFSFPSDGVPILMYHSIADLPGNNLGVPPNKFADQMQYLYDAGYSTITPEQLYTSYLGSGKLPKKPVLITFDDGYPDNYLVAFPILKRHGFVATFFVITGAVDQGMMTWTELKEMQEYGMSIESHTVSHPDLRTVSTPMLKKELADSKATIETKLNTKVMFFCYPSGKYNPETLKELRDLGYTMAVTTAYGKAYLNQDPLLLSRIRINGSSNLETFKRQLSSALKKTVKK